VSAQELRRQADPARRARFEAESGIVQDLNLDLRILAREQYGRERRDLEVAVQVIDRMTPALATLRRQLAAERDPEAPASTSRPSVTEAPASTSRPFCNPAIEELLAVPPAARESDNGRNNFHGL
jgi:hypothetical protein